MHAHTHTHMHAYTHTYIYTYTHTHTHTRTHTHVHTHVLLCKILLIYTCRPSRTHARTHACTHTHTHAHTHTHRVGSKEQQQKPCLYQIAKPVYKLIFLHLFTLPYVYINISKWNPKHILNHLEMCFESSHKAIGLNCKF